jgi:biopolymer transport protein ExbD
MRTNVLLVGVLAVATGCEKKEALYNGPMPVTVGDCAGPNTSWASGPRPAPFLTEQARDVEAFDPKLAAKTPSKDNPPPPEDPPPPEEEDKPDDGADESGGTGTAMALEEGKMGKREEGQYKMKKNEDDATLARQQALEQARNAGIIGSTALVEGGAFASLTGTGDISSGLDDTDIYGGLIGDEAGEMQGGYGFGIRGTGEGGTGWGTIGTGRYGTIGKGSGTGSGYGVGAGRGGMRGRSASVPTVAIGQPNAQGDLDKAIIRRYVKRNIQKIQYCYEKELLAKPGLSGTVSTQFFITPNGEVATASGSGVDPNVASCVAGVIKAIVFPKPKGGGGVQVNYPFTFRPGDGAKVVAKAEPVGSGSAAGSADGSAAGSTDGSGSAATPPVGGGSADAKAPPKEPPPVPPGGYRTGAANPLGSATAELEKCFRKAKKHYGVAVFDFAYDDKGAVTKADVHGLEDANVKKCVLAITKKLKSISPVKAERCSVSFGEMPVAVAPSVEVNADAVVFNGGRMGTTAELTAENSYQFKVPALFDALDTRVRVARSKVVSIQGPLVVKAIDAAKMQVVNKVLNTIRAAGDDFVLGYQGGGADWQLLSLHPLAYPVVPVPFGTGDYFSTARTRIRDAATVMDDSEIVRLSVLVQTDKVWVGLSRVNEFTEIPRKDLAKLGQVLAENKKSAFFADRTDIEIAGDGDAAYIDVINVIKAAQKAGFTRWDITDPFGLSARPQL